MLFNPFVKSFEKLRKKYLNSAFENKQLKSFITSSFGKLLTKPYETKNLIANNADELSKILTKETLCEFTTIGDKFVQVTVSGKKENKPDLKHNITLGSYVYACGRIFLRKR